MAKKWKDPRKRHARVYEDILDSPAWAVLSLKARALFLEFRLSLGETNNGDLSCPMSMVKERHTFKSETTLAAALFELRAVGLIAVTRKGRVVAGSKLPTLFRFTDEPYRQFTKEGGFTFGPGKATFDYMELKTLAQARDVHRTECARLHAEAAKHAPKNAKQKKSTLQKMEREASDSGVHQAKKASAFEDQHPPKASDSGVLLQLGHGVNRKRGAPRDADKVVDGIPMARITCSVATCPDNRCNAVFGEPHANGCPNEACPKCTRQWLTCRCKGVKRWLPKQLRRKAAEVAA